MAKLLLKPQNKKFAPQEISAAVLITLNQAAEDYLGHK